MNPDLQRLQPYPFERLRKLFAGVTPPGFVYPWSGIAVTSGRAFVAGGYDGARELADVIAYDPYLIDGDFPVFVERVPSLDALARASDVVSLHTPLTPETRGIPVIVCSVLREEGLAQFLGAVELVPKPVTRSLSGCTAPSKPTCSESSLPFAPKPRTHT